MKILALLLALLGAASAAAQPAPPTAAASEEMSEYYHDVGVAAVELAGDPAAKVLVYAEFSAGQSGMAVRYQLPGGTVIKQVLDVASVEEATYRLWRFSCDNAPQGCWRGMVYLVDDGKVTVRLLYDGQVDEDKPLWEKSEALEKKFFPGLPIERISI
jgi:hypothetical protein